MINDGESHAIIHEMDIVYKWVGVSGTLTKCDAHDGSHSSEIYNLSQPSIVLLVL